VGYAKRRSALTSKRKSSTRGRSQSRRRGKSLAGYEALVRANRRKPRQERTKTLDLIRQYWGSIEAYRNATRRASSRSTSD
jgi:hypothetical protein